jgi:dihydrofolate reductase
MSKISNIKDSKYGILNTIMIISIIAAMDSKRGLGKDNKLLFKIPEDFQRMQKLTMGHPIIMGRKTFASIGRVLPGRLNIVVTHDASRVQDGLVFAFSLEEALKIASEDERNEIFIFGGGQIYQQAIAKADRLYLTLVEGDFGADTFFPDYSNFTKVISEEEHESSGYKYKFLTLEK